jgi:hypothetical protein
VKNNWLAASNFERMYQVISAINTISVYAKLKVAGVDEPTDELELRQAREELTRFITQFDGQLHEAEQRQDGVVVGDDPRFGELTVRYLSAKRQWLEPSGLYKIPLADLAAMIQTERPQDLPQMIECLRELRILLELHSQADVRDILGDV